MPQSTTAMPPTASRMHAEHGERHPVVRVQPAVERIARQIGSISSHQSGLVVVALSHDHPQHVRPPAAVARAVRIAGLVGKLVMDAVSANPEDRPAFERERCANRGEIFKRLRALVSAVRMQPVIAHADSPAQSHPVERKRCPEMQSS